jgi:hypothetical protein
MPGSRSSALCFLAILVAGASTGCRDWRAHVDPARAAEDPEQYPAEDPTPITEDIKGYRVILTPRADYHIVGYAVALSRESDSRWNFTMPMALGLAWGPAADPVVLARLTFRLTDSLGGLSWGYQITPGAAQIPASGEIKKALGKISVGDLVSLRGKLVDIEVHQGEGPKLMYENTSLLRTDMGDGACEVLWVEEAKSERPR